MRKAGRSPQYLVRFVSGSLPPSAGRIPLLLLWPAGCPPDGISAHPKIHAANKGTEAQKGMRFIQVHSLEPGRLPDPLEVTSRRKNVRNPSSHGACTITPKAKMDAQRERSVWQATFPGSLVTVSLASGTLCTLEFLRPL